MLQPRERRLLLVFIVIHYEQKHVFVPSTSFISLCYQDLGLVSQVLKDSFTETVLNNHSLMSFVDAFTKFFICYDCDTI